MIYPGRRPVVPGGNYALVPDENGADLTPQAGGTLGNKLCYAHKVFIPGRAGHFFHFFFTITYLFPDEHEVRAVADKMRVPLQQQAICPPHKDADRAGIFHTIP
jgi:hypothetical protein